MKISKGKIEMVNNAYARAYVEVLEIFKYLPKKDYIFERIQC